MRSLGVVFISSQSREQPSIPNAIEELHDEPLVLKLLVETLGIAGFPSDFGFCGQRANDRQFQPPAPGLIYKLRSSVTEDISGIPSKTGSSDSVSIHSGRAARGCWDRRTNLPSRDAHAFVEFAETRRQPTSASSWA